jgi:hypothetical protein
MGDQTQKTKQGGESGGATTPSGGEQRSREEGRSPEEMDNRRRSMRS